MSEPLEHVCTCRPCEDCDAPLVGARDPLPDDQHRRIQGHRRCRACYQRHRRTIVPRPDRPLPGAPIEHSSTRGSLQFWVQRPGPSEWRTRGTCAGLPPIDGTPDLWFSDDPGERRAAKEACDTACPVWESCTAYWQANQGLSGIWAGTDEDDRRTWWADREAEEEAAS